LTLGDADERGKRGEKKEYPCQSAYIRVPLAPGASAGVRVLFLKGEKMFQPIMEQILAIARDAWAFLAGLLIVVALLGGLYYVLQGTAGAAFGGSRMTSMAIIGAVGLVILVLFAFLFLPQVGEMLKNFQPKPPF